MLGGGQTHAAAASAGDAHRTGPAGNASPARLGLEDHGWLKAEWKATETGREAKFYALTGKGRKQLEAEVKNWEQLTDAVWLILRTAR